MPGDGVVEGKSDDPKVRLVSGARGASRNVSTGVSASSQDRSTAGGHRAVRSSGGGELSTRMSIQARGFEIPDAHQEELRRLEEAIAGGNPETVKVIVARMGSQEGTEVLTRFQEGFVRTRGAKWKTRQMLDHVDMFFAVYDAMEQCLDEEKLIQFVGAINVRHRFQLLGRAVEKGDNAASSRMMSVFSKQGIDWASNERWRHYRNLLLGAVLSKSCDLFRSMVDILGGTDVVLAHEANTPQSPDVIHWSVRLLHTSCIGGDADMFGLATETFPQVQTASLMRKWRLLDGTVAGGDIDVLKRVVDFMGGEAGLAAPGDYGASGYASQVIGLMRGAIRNHHVVMLRKLSEIFPQEAFTADMGGAMLLGSAIWTGRFDILRIVMDILGEEALRAAAERGGEHLVRAAVRVHNADVLGRIVDVLDEKRVKVIAEKHGASLLASAVRSHDDAVVYRVIDFMGEKAVKTAAAKAGVMLLRLAVASGNTSILTQLAKGMSDAALAAAVQGREVSLLGFAIRSGDDGIVNLVLDIMGEDAVNVALEKGGGVSLLRSAIRVHNAKVFDRVAEILGETAVEAAAEQHGGSLLKAAIACRDVDVVEHVADKMGDAALKKVAESDGASLLRSAVRSENPAVVDRVVEIMGKAVVATVVERHGVSLLKSAVADGNVAVVNRIMGIMGNKELKDAAEKHGASLLGSSIRGGDDAFVDRVLDILENQAVKVAIGEGEESRLTSALASGDVESIEGVVDIVGDASAKLPPDEDGVALLRSTIAGNKEALVRSVARMLRNANVTISTAKDGVSLFRSAIRSRSIVVMEQVFSLLAEKALGVISAMGGAGFLESAIRGGNVELVDNVVNLLGEEAVTAVGKANGFALLETAFVVGDIALVDCVLGIIGDTVVEIVKGGQGTALLQAALRTRDEVIFERVYVMVKGEVKIAGEDRGKLLISAVESRNVILVNRILYILGNTAAENAIKEQGYRLLESAIWNEYVVSVRSLSDIFGQSATEGGVGSHSSLSARRMVYSDNTAVIDRVVEIMGEKALKNELKENGPSLLRWATTGGDVAVVERVMNIVGYAAVRSAVEQGDESLLSFAIQSRDMAFLERVVDALGVDAMSIAAENEGVSLLEDAIWTLDVLTVDRVVDMLGAVEVESAVEKGGRFLLKSAIESRSVVLVDRVMDILGGEAVENEVQKDGRSLLRSAIQSRDEDTLERVVDVLGVKRLQSDDLLASLYDCGSDSVFLSDFRFVSEAVEHAAKESGGSLLKSAVQSYDMTFFDRVVDVLGAEAIKVALEKDGGVLLASAIQSRDATFVNRVVNIVGDAAVATAVKEDGVSLLKYAVESRDVALVEDVIEIVGGANEAEEDVQSLLGSALAGGDVTAFGRIVDTLGDETVSQAVMQAPQKDGGLLVTFAPAPDDGMAFVEGVVDALRNAVVVPKRVVNYIRNGLREIASRSTGGADHFNKVLELLSRQAREKTVAAQLITEKVFLRHFESILELAVKAENLEVVQVATAWINAGLPQWEAVKACTDALEVAQEAQVASKEISDRALEIISLLLRFGAIPHYDLMAHLMVLSEHYQTKLRTCLMDSVCFAPNPFVPGMNLLVLLSEICQGIPPSKRKASEDIKQDLTRLLNEVLEQLPKSVDACPGKIATCLALFEVQTTKKRLPTGFAGPLGVAFRDRMAMEMLCSKPLVLDFMSYRFDVGNAADGAHTDEARALEDRLVLFNSKFYRVPKWRMAFDVEIYILFLYYYTSRVLLYDGDPSIYESAFIIYIVGALMIEINELRRDSRGYFQDRWNVLDFLAITLLTAGWFVRMSDNETLWGRALYALGVPLLFSRALFFAEFLQVQGPMIHVIFGMAMELMQFGVVMLVVMLGFAVSLVALYEDSGRPYSYGDACLDLFKAMLGELQLLDEIGDEDQSVAATVLVVVYLVVMTIMLLNLLIAVLSAAHSQVQDRNGLEYIVSKASVIQRYVLVVEHDLLPAPFNLFQVAIGAPFKFLDVFTDRRADKLYPQAKEHVGMVIFWLFSGPAIIATGTVKSLLGLRIYEAIKRYMAKQRTAPSWRNECWLPFSILIATPMITPINLCLLWIVGGVLSIVRFFRSLGGKMEIPQVSGPGKVDNAPVKHGVASMLKNSRAGLSVAELQERLEDPMNDPEVRHEEREQATKVEHLKLLRDRLEKTSASEAQALWERMKHMDDRVGGVEKTLRVMTDKLDSLGRAISERS